MTSEQETARRRQAEYLIVGVGVTGALLLGHDVDWLGTTELHTVMEVVATLLAAIVGMMALVRYYSKADAVYLFIGVGFLGTAFLDGYHAFVTATYFTRFMPSDPRQLIPWSWVASRQFLSVLMFLSCLAWRREERLGVTGRIPDRSVYFGAGFFTLASFIFFAFVPLPAAYYPETFFHRPEEFGPALFFGLALFGYLRKGRWRDDAFEHWLVLSLIVGFISQLVFMSHSEALFDYEFDVAHTLKKISYVFVLIGLMLSMSAIFRKAGEDEQRVRIKAAELDRMNRDLSQFNYAVSHDLKAPLRAIHNYADFLAEDLDGTLNDEQQGYLRSLRQAVEEGETLIEDILELSQLSQKDLVYDRLDLGQFLRDTIDRMALPPEVSVDMDGRWPVILAPTSLLRQIFQNIIANGVKFNISENKTLRITCREIDASVYEVAITDNGIGIPERFHGTIFHVFKRLHTQEKFQGTGIGLAIVSKAIDRLGGSVRVESNEGQGSSFYVMLPQKRPGV